MAEHRDGYLPGGGELGFAGVGERGGEAGQSHYLRRVKEVFGWPGEPWPGESVQHTVEARIQRQDILARPKPPMLWYVMHEGMLRHVIGDPEIMGEQVGKLIKAAEAPRIVIQVLPFTAHEHAGTEGPIWIYERVGGSMVAYTECYGGGRLIEGQDEVADLTKVMGMLRAAALSPKDSLHLMRAIGRDLGG